MGLRCSSLSVLLFVAVAYADGPGDNLPDKVRRVPPPGIALPDPERSALEDSVAELGREIDALRAALKDRPKLLELLPDVQVYHNAVRYALAYDEFHQPREAAVARSLLQQGRERAQAMREGKAPWAAATGLVVRGYRSRIDDSVQPYGLVVPASWRPDTPHLHRLDCWFHGRGETLSELNFIDGRQMSPGEFTPPHAFVLHPYGRYCNANKFAGEVDLFEALAHVRKHYAIDQNRIAVRGFSMGGAACWQFAVHYPGLWAAAAPGAGFAETPEFLRVFQNESVKPTWYEQKLWHWYDCTDYAGNLFNCPTVAYSGADDRQKQAADVMAKALAAEGLSLVHILGPKTGHRYHPQAKEEINRRIDGIVAAGREAVPAEVHFTTWTLRYNECAWVRLDGLEQHWERATVHATLTTNQIAARTKNVLALTFALPAGYCPTTKGARFRVVMDDDPATGMELLPMSDRSLTVHVRKVQGKWTQAPAADDGTLRKRPGLQGPIDDAFMDRFLMVRPTGTPLHDKTGAWVSAEMKHAIDHWRRQFRGEARVKDDTAITDADLADSNLILWGDSASNSFLAKIVAKLPVRWEKETIRVGDKTYPASQHVPLLIYPNPLNPKRYVVLNSGFTFREYDYLNNARQVPKLPDYAVLDVSVPPSSRVPGSVVATGFFDEQWRLGSGQR